MGSRVDLIIKLVRKALEERKHFENNVDEEQDNGNSLTASGKLVTNSDAEQCNINMPVVENYLELVHGAVQIQIAEDINDSNLSSTITLDMRGKPSDQIINTTQTKIPLLLKIMT